MSDDASTMVWLTCPNCGSPRPFGHGCACGWPDASLTEQDILKVRMDAARHELEAAKTLNRAAHERLASALLERRAVEDGLKRKPGFYRVSYPPFQAGNTTGKHF